MVRYGYARISTKEQKLDRQIQALENQGIDILITDRQSGKNFDRKGYQSLKERLQKGDELYIQSIDRLGRNYEDVLKEWRILTQEKEVDIIVLDFPLLNTQNQVQGLTGRFLASLILQILSYVSQIEREMIRERQREGIIVAREKGVHFGRPRLEHPENYQMVADLYRTGKIKSIREAAQLLHVSYSTLRSWLVEDNRQNH